MMGHICGKLGPHCAECGDVGTNLCDYVVGARSKTCDRPLCDYCAQEVGDNLHYCAEHHALVTMNDLPARIQLRRIKGWRLPEGAVRVARPGKWGNPFSVAEHGREQAIALFSAYLDQQLAAGALDITELRGKALACWCRLDEPCHADVLIKRANI
nr:DUF4326 domain-containing protein [Pseudomonas luteola]